MYGGALLGAFHGPRGCRCCAGERRRRRVTGERRDSDAPMWVAHVPCLLGPVRGHVENDRPHGPAWKVVQLFDYYYFRKKYFLRFKICLIHFSTIILNLI
jgi:hypothetical protein